MVVLLVSSFAPLEVKVTSLNDFILVVFWDTITKPEKSNPSFGLKEKFEADYDLTVGLETTLKKLIPSDLIGLASHLKGKSCEEVRASEELIALGISDEQFFNLFKVNLKFLLS